MYFEVNSLDYWDRHRIEGYGYLILPRNPGSYKLNIETWRPHGTFYEELSRYFIGGGPLLPDKKLVYIKNINELKFNSRVAWNTLPSGNIQIHLEIIHSILKSKLEEVRIENIKELTSIA